MKLDEYLRTNNLDDEAFAALIGDHSAHAVKKWRYGERTPRADAMRKIHEVTNGCVTPTDFFDAGAGRDHVHSPPIGA
jgi:hypothetical protein